MLGTYPHYSDLIGLSRVIFLKLPTQTPDVGEIMEPTSPGGGSLLASALSSACWPRKNSLPPVLSPLFILTHLPGDANASAPGLTSCRSVLLICFELVLDLLELTPEAS